MLDYIEKQQDFIEEISNRLALEYDKKVLAAFGYCGFSSEYLKLNSKEFSIIEHGNTRTYNHKDKALFSTHTETMLDEYNYDYNIYIEFH